MRVGVLGPVVIEDDGVRRDAEPSKVRALLAVLATHLGHPVPVGTLVAALWGEHAPPSAEKTLQGHVSSLRRQLGDDVIATSPAAYALEMPGDEVDVARFEELVAEATTLGESDWASSRALCAEALELWRGEPLADLADGAVRDGLAARLGELHWAALCGRIEADLALGRHRQILPELRQLVADAPLRDDLRADLMLALYRCDRQVDALESYRDLRKLLLEELGLDPSPRLQQLERRILLHDAELDLAPPATDNLPIPLSSFIGREAEILAVQELIHEHRLVTLLGPGGVGKSRLAVEVARREIAGWDAVRWVDLANATHDSAVLARVADALDVTSAPGVRLEDALAAHVRGRSLLVVVDNCERVLRGAAAAIALVLDNGPTSVVLATSRLPVGLAGEHRQPVAPLGVPDPEEPEPSSVDSVRLFLERAEARGVRLDSPEDVRSVAEICRGVDGLPLAIELVATRTSVLGPSELAAQVADRSQVLAIDAPELEPRHRSMGEVFDRSLDLLDPALRATFARLAVFPGDFDLEAAVAVACPGDDRSSAAERLGVLVESSLLTMDGPPGPRRFRLLDLVRDHALARLGSDGSLVEAERCHAEHYRDLAIAAGPRVEGAEAGRWLAIIGREDHNLRSAIDWFLRHDRAGDALEFAAAIGHAWYVRGDFGGSRRLLETLIAAGGDARPELLAVAHLRMAWPAFLGGDGPAARRACVEARRRFEDVGDRVGVAETLRAEAHMIVLGTGDTDRALPLYQAAIDSLGDSDGERERAWDQITMMQAVLLADRYRPEVDAVLDQAQSALEAAGDVLGLAHLAMDRVFVAYATDDLDALEQAAMVELGHSRAIGDVVYEQIALVALGLVRTIHLDDPSSGALLLGRAVALAWETGNLLQLGVALQAVAAVTIAAERERGARVWGAAMGLSPAWPLFERRYGELLDPVRSEMGGRFDDAVSAGGRLSPAEAVELAQRTLEGWTAGVR